MWGVKTELSSCVFLCVPFVLDSDSPLHGVGGPASVFCVVRVLVVEFLRRTVRIAEPHDFIAHLGDTAT